LDAKLSGATADGLTIAEVRIAGGLCEPTSYLAACRQTADALVATGLLDPLTADRRLGEIEARIHRLAESCRRRVVQLRGMPVVVSTHQEAFCRWLGLRPVATFTGVDSAGVRQLNDAVRHADQADVRLIIANRPEGRRVADALADRLRARVVVFENFPASNSGQSSFDDLLTANVDALIKAAEAR
jgi:ABC-type Zn uptake system ZnuABC Zn-binding protein ZnuA